MATAHQVSPYAFETTPGVYELQVLGVPDDGAPLIETTGVEVVDAPAGAVWRTRESGEANDNAIRSEVAAVCDEKSAAGTPRIPYVATLRRVL